MPWQYLPVNDLCIYFLIYITLLVLQKVVGYPRVQYLVLGVPHGSVLGTWGTSWFSTWHLGYLMVHYLELVPKDGYVLGTFCTSWFSTWHLGYLMVQYLALGVPHISVLGPWVSS